MLPLTPVAGLTPESLRGNAMILYGNAPTLEFGNDSIGSLGYRLQVPSLPRLSLDLLAHAGYAQVMYNNGNADFTDASPQVGVGIAPHA